MESREKMELQSVIAAGITDIKYSVDGNSLFVCANSQGCYAIDSNGEVLCELSASEESFTTIAVHPVSRMIAIGTEGHTVAQFKQESKSNCPCTGLYTRAQSCVHHVTYSRTGLYLYVASDDSCVRQINTADTNQCIRLMTDGPVRSIAIDKSNANLAAAHFDGSLSIFSVREKKVIQRLENVFPVVTETDFQFLRLTWTSRGELLLPGNKDVYFVEAGKWERTVLLTDGHTDAVSLISVCPSGRYVATAGLDLSVVVWDLEAAEAIDKYKVGVPICGLDWNPFQNELAVVCQDGRFGLWKNVIPSHMTPPCSNAAAVPRSATSQATHTPAALGNVIDDMAEEGNAEEKEDDDDDEKEVQSQVSGKSGARSEKGKRITRAMDEDDVDNLEDMDLDEEDEQDEEEEYMFGHQAGDSDEESDEGGVERVDQRRTRKYAQSTSHFVAPVKVQKAFQPCATPMMKRTRFLAWNLTGSIITIEEMASNSVDIDFLNTEKRRPVRFKEHYGFSMAALDEYGAVFASRQNKAESIPSVLCYKAFDSWATQGEWFIYFKRPSEDILAVACGKQWVAVVTNNRYLRIFTASGIQRHILCIDGPVVTMCGRESQLAVIYNNGSGLKGEYDLSCLVLSVRDQRIVARVKVPLRPGSRLEWAGFSDSGMMCVYDTEEVLSILLPEWDFQWMPVFDGSLAKKTTKEHYWAVAVGETSFTCVVCKGESTYPMTAPKPLPMEFPFHTPLINVAGTLEAEEQIMKQTLLLAQLRRLVEDGDSSREHDLLKNEILSDSSLLKLVQKSCDSEHELRAMDAAMMLVLKRSVEGAIRIAQVSRMPALAQRMHLLQKNVFGAEPRAPVDVIQPFLPYTERAFTEEREATLAEVKDTLSHILGGQETALAALAKVSMKKIQEDAELLDEEQSDDDDADIVVPEKKQKKKSGKAAAKRGRPKKTPRKRKQRQEEGNDADLIEVKPEPEGDEKKQVPKEKSPFIKTKQASQVKERPKTKRKLSTAFQKVSTSDQGSKSETIFDTIAKARKGKDVSEDGKDDKKTDESRDTSKQSRRSVQATLSFGRKAQPVESTKEMSSTEKEGEEPKKNEDDESSKVAKKEIKETEAVVEENADIQSDGNSRKETEAVVEDIQSDGNSNVVKEEEENTTTTEPQGDEQAKEEEIKKEDKPEEET